MPVTTVPVIGTTNTLDVIELQEPIYTLEDEQVKTASSTHTTLEQIPNKSRDNRNYSLEQIQVAVEILKVFPDKPLMVEIAFCESELSPTADRQNLGIDVGVFQINQIHLSELNKLGLDRKILKDNLTYARLLYDKSGLKPWSMSKPCWSKYA